MATFVIVHGGWGGGWEWREVAERLRTRGHVVFTPTLTGLGDRAHLATAEVVDASAHAADVLAVLDVEELHDVVLCGHSYGGVPVTLAADHRPERLRSVIYVDAIVPDEGDSVLDVAGSEFAGRVRAGLAEHGPAWRVPIPDELLPVGGDDVARERYIARLRDHPAASFAEPMRLRGGLGSVRRSFVRCAEDGDDGPAVSDPAGVAAARARAQGWDYRELVGAHDVQLTDPGAIATLLDELA